MQYRPGGQWTVDAGYSHIFLSDAAINNNGHDPSTAPAVGTLVGEYKSGIDLFGIQVSYAF
jgi:long-subunit fatty acid transport protein